MAWHGSDLRQSILHKALEMTGVDPNTKAPEITAVDQNAKASEITI